jgi:xylulokinase
MNECFLGLDIGTGSSKGAIVDIEGNVLCQASVPHKMSIPEAGWYEQDADRIWWGDFVLLCRKLLGNLQHPKESIKGVALSTIGPCVLPLDKEGKPLRPGILYGIDTRAEMEIRELEETLGREVIFAKTGQDLSSQSCCPKILWIRKNEPDVWEKTSKILTASGYLVYKLTGRYTLDIYTAIGYAPIFDLAKRTWDPSLAGLITEMDKLPELLWSSQVAGEVTPKAAALTGLPPGVPVVAGTTDAASEALGAGVEKTGDMMMMYGSSNFFILKTETLKPGPPWGVCLNGLGNHFPVAVLPNGKTWLRNLLLVPVVSPACPILPEKEPRCTIPLQRGYFSECPFQALREIYTVLSRKLWDTESDIILRRWKKQGPGPTEFWQSEALPKAAI